MNLLVIQLNVCIHDWCCGAFKCTIMKDLATLCYEIVMVHIPRKGWVTLVLNCRIALSC
jgi:hypothetical protein